MICTCPEPNLDEIASLARAGLCETDQVRCILHIIPSPPPPCPPQTHTGATCLLLFSALQYFSTYFLPLPHTQTSRSKKETKKTAACSPNIQIMQGTFPPPPSYRTQIGLRRPTIPPIRRRYRFSLRNLHKIIHFRCRTQLGQRLHQTTRQESKEWPSKLLL